MRKILTFFTALVVAFAFLLSASPPALASNAPAVEKNMKVLIVGEHGAGQIVAALAAARDLSVVLVKNADELPEIEAPDLEPVYSKTIFARETSDNFETVPISKLKTVRQAGKNANYRPPTVKSFIGFDNPARAKI